MGSFGNHGAWKPCFQYICGKLMKVKSPICWTFYQCRAAKVMRKRADIDISVGDSVGHGPGLPY